MKRTDGLYRLLHRLIEGCGGRFIVIETRRYPVMKKLAPIFLSFAILSAILIGCDFVDGNTSYVESEEPTVVDSRFYGYFAAPVDTTGNEDPRDMEPGPPHP